MRTLLTLLGALLIAVTIWDVFITVFSASGAGVLTDRFVRALWSTLLWVHRRRAIHGLLALTDPFVLAASIALWYLLLGLGIYLLLVAHTGAVVHAQSGERATLLEQLYFVSTTISSLGYGDLIPSRLPFTLISTLATTLATTIITVALSYVLSVLNAAIDRRTLAQAVFGLGTSSAQILDHAQLHDAHGSMKNHLMALSSQIDRAALRQLAYPVVKFFHSPRPELSPARALLLLSDTCFLAANLPEERRPPAGLLALLGSSIANYTEYKHARIVLAPRGEEPRSDALIASARDLGIADHADAPLWRRLEAYRSERARLVALCREDGWDDG